MSVGNGKTPDSERVPLKDGDVLTEEDITLDDRLDDRVSEEEALDEARRKRAKGEE